MAERLYAKCVSELSRMVHQKEIKPSELCAGLFSRCDNVEPKINAFICLDREAAMQRAKELDEIPITPQTSRLFGIPIAINDNICTRDMPTTCASKMLKDFRPPFNATAVSRLCEQGAVIMGKTNMDEFAMGSSGETSIFGPARNPHDTGRVPGGASSGSAAAVAAGSAVLALGSDTGGDVRLPAAFCGTVGYKPTYGAVSRYGLISYAGSLDQIGTLSRTVSGAALLASAIAGHDPMDATSNPGFIPDFSGIEEFDVKNKRIGVIKECFDQLPDDMYKGINVAKEIYKSLGAIVEDVSLPMINHSLPIHYIIALAEASSGLAKYDGVRFGHRCDKFDDIDSLYVNSRTEGFGAAVKQRIWLGTYLLSGPNIDAYYKRARIAQAMLREQFKDCLAKYNVLLTPVSPITAFRFEERPNNSTIRLTHKFTAPVNAVGLPAVSLPCSKDRSGMPVNFQLIGKWFDDSALFGFARALERNADATIPVAEVK